MSAGEPSIAVGRAAGALRGRVRVPGSKSLSTRAIVLASISPAPIVLRNLLVADDTRTLLDAVETMGVRAARLFGADWRVDGRGLRAGEADVSVNLGDGGAPTRFAMALAALRRGATVIDGSARMRERPIADGIDLLRALGAQVDEVEAPRRLPVRVHGLAPAPARPEITVGRTASSQFVSAIMLVAPALHTERRIRFDEPPTSASYLALTIDALRAFGATVSGRAAAAGDRIEISPGLAVRDSFEVPADASSAVVWVAAAAMVPGSRLELEGVVRDSQPDLRAIEAIGAMGAKLEWRADALVVEHAPLRGIDVDASDWPDGSLAVAAAASAATGATRLRSLGTLRVKESDRLAALAQEFGRLGVRVRVVDDDLVIEPGAAGGEAAPAAVDPHDDHRIAMSAALVALRRGAVRISHPSCVAKSYPGFWSDLARLTHATGGIV